MPGSPGGTDVAVLRRDADRAVGSRSAYNDGMRADLLQNLFPEPPLVITGAGISTASGIPDYRDAQGQWKRKPPVQYQAFVGSAAVRRRYWARSLVGWRRFAAAEPNPAHCRLAELERDGWLAGLITQNVDALHQRAGSQTVIDLHGRLDRVICLGCGMSVERDAFQALLVEANPDFADLNAASAPDGDAELEGVAFAEFRVPDCPDCGGIYKPDVVFFGENVPAERARLALSWARQAPAVLVVGSSLMVWSSYRLVRAAAERGVPVYAFNQGRTRADDMLTRRFAGDCAQLLEGWQSTLAGQPAASTFEVAT